MKTWTEKDKQTLADELVEEWTAVSLATGPSDRDGCVKALEAICTDLKEPFPKRVEFMRSPREAKRWMAEHYPEESVDGSKFCYGNHDSFWVASNEFCRQAESDRYVKEVEGYKLMAQSGGWWLHYDELAVFCDRPTVVHLDDENRLHCEDGPALAFADGFEFYAFADVDLEPWMVNEKSKISIQNILDQENVEVQLILQEFYGRSRYLKDIGAKVVHMDRKPVDSRDPKGPEIVRALVVDGNDRKWLVAGDGSTKDRVFVMRASEDATNCQEAEQSMCPGVDLELAVGRS